MTLTASFPQYETLNRPTLVDADAFVASVEEQYRDRGEIPPIWYLILAGGKAENASIFDGQARNQAKTDIGASPFHPQTKSTWETVEYSDHRLMTRQELYQPRKQRIAVFSWRNPEIAERLEREVGSTYLQRIAEDRSFTESLFYHLQQHGYLTIRQIETLQQHWQQEDAKPIAQPAPSGRTTVIGTVKTVRQERTPHGVTNKMLVQDDTGYTTWGTVPKSLDAEPGDRVQFDATLKPTKDVTHAFFSRPTKALLLELQST